MPTSRSLTLLIALVAFGLTSLAASTEASAGYKTRTNLNTVPTGAEVYLVSGGADKLLGVTPLKRVRLPRGAIKLRFKKDGYDDLEQNLEIGRRIQSYVFNLVRTIQPGTLEFMGAAEFTGAAITVDGKAQGAVPTSVKVPPGRHHAVVVKDGFERWERWIDVTENQQVSFDVVLKPTAAAPGEILVTSTPSGGDVRVNGAPRGKTPTVLEGLAPGQYLVDVALDDYQSFSRTVDVESGKRVVIDAQLAKHKAGVGEVKILSTQPNTTVSVDGEEIGTAPVTRSGFKPGVHLIEARTAAGEVATAQVEVRAGETVVVRLEPKSAEVAATKARVRVVANAAGAKVDIDGVRNGPSPFVVDDLDPGTHFITVTAPGYATWQRSVTLKAGGNPEVVAELGQSGQVEVRTKSGAAAEIFVDGKPIGHTPFAGTLPLGTHKLLVKRADGALEEFDIAVGPDRVVKVTAAFGAEDPNHVPDNTRPMTWSARAMPAGTGSLDVHLGWPYMINLQAGGGVGSGFDIGVQLRSAFDVINELEARVQWTFAQTKTIAASIEAGIGAGIGADDRNSFILRALAKGSVMVGSKAAISARIGTLLYSDRTGPETIAAHADRDTGVRLTLGFSIEMRLTDELNGFIIFDGDPLGGGRNLYEQSYLSDTKMYGSLGVSWLF